jgi:hypothetical protein
VKWWCCSFKIIEDYLNCEIIHCLPEEKLAEIQKWSDLDRCFWFSNLTILDINNSISRISWNCFKIDQHKCEKAILHERKTCCLWEKMAKVVRSKLAVWCLLVLHHTHNKKHMRFSSDFTILRLLARWLKIAL